MASEKKHIALVCTRLDLPGGIERAVVNCANLFQSNGHAVTLLILDTTAESFYPINKAINIINAPLHFGITGEGNAVTRKISFYKHIKHLKKLLQQTDADVVIGTEYSITVATYLAARNLKVKVFAWEHHHFHWLKKNRFWNFLFHYVYPKLDAVVCNNVTEKGLFEAVGCKAVVIPYVLPQQHGVAALEQNILLTIGWLIKRKGVDMIPAIAKKIFSTHKNWKWRIIGKGEEGENLLKQIEEAKLSSFVEVVQPQSHELAEEYRNASIYIMTSRFECLPMVLLESTAHGLPVIAFDCPTGPADIIDEARNGYLVPLEDVDAMARRIEELMNDAEKRKRMGRAAYESSKRYSPEGIYRLWETVLNDAAFK